MNPQASNSNPVAAIAAATATGERVGGVVLSELTFAKAALLERIKSPYATGQRVSADQSQLDDLMRALFILAHPAQHSGDLLRDGSFASAVEVWGDTLTLPQLNELGDAVKRIFKRVEDVTPNGAPEAGKKPQATTAG